MGKCTGETGGESACTRMKAGWAGSAEPDTLPPFLPSCSWLNPKGRAATTARANAAKQLEVDKRRRARKAEQVCVGGRRTGGRGD